jgi:hypothetical protein
MSAAALRSLPFRARPEAALLASIHLWALRQAPRLAALRPHDAGPGDVVFLEGDGLDGADLRVHFGDHAAWAISLSNGSAVAVVPLAASGPAVVTVTRQGLRSNGLAWGGPPGDGPGAVVRVDPPDGAVGVLADSPVVARLSHPVHADRVAAGAFEVWSQGQAVPGTLRCSPAGHLLIWSPASALDPGQTHEVRIHGLQDVRGREVTPHVSTFTPCDLISPELSP